MSLVQLFYISRAASPYDSNSVKAILSASRRNNQRDDVTGCLLFSGCCFAQVLEGKPEIVLERVERISSDARHLDFRLLVERSVSTRGYGDWAMGYLYDLDFEDELTALLQDSAPSAERMVRIMERMKPDTVMGALSELT